jgi:hypothetical protein
MKADEIERLVLRLWTTTQVPLTVANLQAYTGAPRKALQAQLDVMLGEQTLEIDSDDDGNVHYTVPGAARMKGGLTTIGEVQRFDELRGARDPVVGGMQTALQRYAAPVEGSGKSVAVSGLLSFFLGPFGLLYAAPITEALVPIAVTMAAATLLPAFIVGPLLSLAAPVFGAAGVVYAVKHNKRGRRTSLLPENDGRKLLGP